MSGIKSAIELAMERTKNLVMSEEERKSFAAKELEHKVRAVVRRYLEGIIESDGVNKELAAVEGDEKSIKSLFVDLLVDEFDVKERNECLLDLLSDIAGRIKEPLRQELEAMRGRYAEQIKNSESAVRGKIIGRLKEMGIAGSAVEPNTEEWDEWGESIKEAGESFKKSLTGWKNKLKADISK
jgi:hypothetical protein